MSDDDGVISQWCTVIQQRAGTLIFEEASERPVEGVVSDRTRVTRLEFSILYHNINRQPTALSPFLCAGCSHQGVGFPERSGSFPIRSGGFVQSDSVLQASRLEEQQDARFIPAVRGLLEQTACIW